MSQFLNALNNFIWGPPLIILMIVTGAYFTVRSGFFQVRHLGYIFHRTLGRLFHHDDEPGDEKGLLTPYEAIATAVGGSVGSAISPVWPPLLPPAAPVRCSGCG